MGLAVALCLTGTASARTPPSKQASRSKLWTERALLPLPRTAGPDVAALVRATSRSVVSITTHEPSRPDNDDGQPTPPLAGMLKPPQLEKGVGSGFIVREDGLVITNAHVVQGARAIHITLADQGVPQKLPAELVGIDAASDVALLRVRAGRKLPVLPLGESDAIQVGQWVVAQGSPFGLAHTVSVGVVSYVGRSDVTPEGFSGFRDYLQTDAAINPGSSGGPLCDLRGRVVGIVDAVNPTGQGIAFAMPIDMAKRVLPSLLAFGGVRPSWLGLTVQDLTADLARAFHARGPNGAVVSELDPHGPGAEAGVQPGDVIVRFDGHPVRHSQHLRWLVEAAPVDRPVKLAVLRQGRLVSLSVKASPAPNPLVESRELAALGAQVADLDVPTARSVGLTLPNGARVMTVRDDGPARAAGIRAGDVVTRAGGLDVAEPEDLARALVAAGEQPVRLTIRRGSHVLHLELHAR